MLPHRSPSGRFNAMILSPSRIGSQPKRCDQRLHQRARCRARPRRGRAQRVGVEDELLVLGADPPVGLRLLARGNPCDEVVARSHELLWRAILACRHGLWPRLFGFKREPAARYRVGLCSLRAVYGWASRPAQVLTDIALAPRWAMATVYATRFTQRETRALHLRSRHRQSPNTALTRARTATAAVSARMMRGPNDTRTT